MKKSITPALVAAASLLVCELSTPRSEPGARNDNWPQWRGPYLNGVSTETGLPLRWGADENIRWKLSLPSRSGSTPIVWNEHVFLHVAETDDLYLWAVDRKDGEVIWRRPLDGGNYDINKQNMSSPSPVTDGERVWVLTGTGHLKAFRFDGTELWHRDLQRDYGEFGQMWGYASSPLLYGGGVFVQVLHGTNTDQPSYLLRVDGVTGETSWRVERVTDAEGQAADAYSTPTVIETDAGAEIVVTGGNVVTGHDPDTGRELWRAGGLNPRGYNNHRTVASPVVISGVVFAPSRVRPLLAIRSGGRGDVSQSARLWAFDRGPGVPTPVGDGTHLFVVDDRGIIWCLDARTGEPLWGPQRLPPGTYSASPVLADGRLYVTNEDGVTAVLRAGREFEVLAVNDLDDFCLSSPAISDGQIFIRTTTYLHCIETPR